MRGECLTPPIRACAPPKGPGDARGSACGRRLTSRISIAVPAKIPCDVNATSCGRRPERTKLATLNDFVQWVTLKELYAAQLDRSSNGLDVFCQDALRNCVEVHASGLTRDILDVAVGWIPELSQVTPSSLLPDLDNYPTVARQAIGLTAQHRCLLLECFEMLLVRFTDGTLAAHADLALPLLPRPHVVNICIQVASAFEHYCLHQNRGAIEIMYNQEMDLLHLEQNLVSNPGQSQRMQYQLVEELLGCRQRIFRLEKDLAKEVRTGAANHLRAKKDHEGLLNANHLLQRILRDEREQSNFLKDMLAHFEERSEKDQWLVEKQAERVEELEKEVEQLKNMEKSLSGREQNYGHRIVDLHLQEFEVYVRQDDRTKRLAKMKLAMQAEQEGNLVGKTPEAEVDEIALQQAQKLKLEMRRVFEERVRQYDDHIKCKEAKLAERQSVLEEIHKLVYEARERVDTGMQTENNMSSTFAMPALLVEPPVRRASRGSISPRPPGVNQKLVSVLDRHIADKGDNMLEKYPGDPGEGRRPSISAIQVPKTRRRASSTCCQYEDAPSIKARTLGSVDV